MLVDEQVMPGVLAEEKPADQGVPVLMEETEQIVKKTEEAVEEKEKQEEKEEAHSDGAVVLLRTGLGAERQRGRVDEEGQDTREFLLREHPVALALDGGVLAGGVEGGADVGRLERGLPAGAQAGELAASGRPVEHRGEVGAGTGDRAVGGGLA